MDSSIFYIPQKVYLMFSTVVLENCKFLMLQVCAAFKKFFLKKYCLKFHHLEMPNNRISSEQFAFFCECKGKLVIRRLNKFINKLDVAHLKAE